MSTQRTRQSMTQEPANEAATEDTSRESFEAILAEALKDVEAPIHRENAEEDLNVELDQPEPDVDVGETEPQTIEDLVGQLLDIAQQIAAEVGVGGDEDEDFDDDFADETVEDDLSNVSAEAAGAKGHPIRGKGKTLQSKNNKVKGKLNKRGSKATATGVTARHGDIGPAPKSNLHDKSKQKVPGQKNPGDDLF